MGEPAGPSLVVLAAGLGSRFGGPKQLVEVGPGGATITDVLLARAAAAGFARAVIVVAPGMEARFAAHWAAVRGARFRADLPVDWPVDFVAQQLRPGRAAPLGTADAVLAVRELVGGSFAVVNADDLYPADAFVTLAEHLRHAAPTEHALVAFRVARTLVGERPVSRAIVDADATGALVMVREGRIVTAPAGLRFEALGSGDELVRPLAPDERVSMNMWGFRTSVFDALAVAVAEFVAVPLPGEVFLPHVVGSMVAAGAVVRVLVSEGECIGLTHDDDLAAVRSALR